MAAAGGEIISVIQSVVKAMKSFIEKLEQTSKSLAQTLQEYSTEAAGKIRTEMINVFHTVERSIENEINALTTRLKAISGSLKKSKLKSGTSMMQNLEKYVKESVNEIEQISSKFIAKVELCISKFEDSLKMISKEGGKILSETFSDVEKFIGDTLKKVHDVGEESISGIKSAIAPVTSQFSHIESLVFKHEVKVAENAAVSFFDPYMFVSFILAGGAILAATNYNPK